MNKLNGTLENMLLARPVSPSYSRQMRCFRERCNLLERIKCHELNEQISRRIKCESQLILKEIALQLLIGRCSLVMWTIY
jgi:hypothetical protein